MSPQSTTVNWKKWGSILGCLVVAWQLTSYVYNAIESNKASIEKDAADRATRQAEWNNYRMKMEQRLETLEQRASFGFCDSLKDAINELDQKTHLKPKF